MLDEKEQKIYDLALAESAMKKYDKTTLKAVEDEKKKEQDDKEVKPKGKK